MLNQSRVVLLTIIAGLSATSLFAQAPSFSAAGVVNGASFSMSLSPGAVASIFGQNLSASASACAVTKGSAAPTTLCGTQVTVGGKSAALLFVSQGQVDAQIPVDAALGQAQITLTVQGTGSASATVNIAAYAPGLPLSGQGAQQTGLFQHGKDLSVVTTQSPAQPGEMLVVPNVIGLGPTSPSVPTGAAAPTSAPFALTVAQPTISAGCQQVSVSFSGLAPGGFVGFYQLNFTLPASAPGGNLPVTLTIGGQTSNTVTLPVAGSAIPVVNAVVNGSFSSSDVVAAPGTIVSIFGCNFGSKDNLTPFPSTNFQGLSATFSGIPAPLFAVVASANQINVLAPTELPESGTVNVQVANSTGSSSNFSLKMSAATPGIFRLTDPSKASRKNGAVLFANTAWRVVPASMATALGWNSCAGLTAGATCGQPAGAGDYIQIFLTGLGRATPNGDPNGKVLATGSVAPADGSVIYQTVQKPTVTVGGVGTAVLFAGLAPGYAGLYQINVQVPTGVTPGDDVPVAVSMPNGGKDDTTTIAVDQ